MKRIYYLITGILFLLNTGCVSFFEEAKTIPEDKLLITLGGAKNFVYKKYYVNVQYYDDTPYNFDIHSFTFRYGTGNNSEMSLEATVLGLLIGFKRQIFKIGNFYTSIKPSFGKSLFFNDGAPFLLKIGLLQSFSLPENDIYWGIGSIASGENHIIGSAFIGYTQHPGKKNRDGIRFEAGYFYNYERYRNEIRDASYIYVGAALDFDVHL